MNRIICLLSVIVASVMCVEIDNGVLGVPEVMCREDNIRLVINVRQPFAGHVYVKSQFHTAGCHSSYVANPVHPKEVVFEVPYRAGCLVRRERSLNPKGVVYHATVIIQFHHQFVTKVDKAYALSCLYQEHEKQLQQQLDVSVIPTTELTGEQRMPTCAYQILSDNLNGQPVRFARIGDKLFHKWECVPAETHGMLVHSCVARDGTGNEHQLIDEQGCSMDPIGLGELSYAPDLMTAWVQSHAFKFADRLQINFQCRVTVCVKVDGGCDGITPPRCSAISRSGDNRILVDPNNPAAGINAGSRLQQPGYVARDLASPPSDLNASPPSSISLSGSSDDDILSEQQEQVLTTFRSTPPYPETTYPRAYGTTTGDRSYSHQPRGLDNSGLVPYAALRQRRSDGTTLENMTLATDDILLFGAGDNYEPPVAASSESSSCAMNASLQWVYQVVLSLAVITCICLAAVAIWQRSLIQSQHNKTKLPVA